MNQLAWFLYQTWKRLEYKGHFLSWVLKVLPYPSQKRYWQVSHPVKLWKPMIDSKNNSYVALQTFIDVTKFSPTALHVIWSWCQLPHDCFLNFLQQKWNRGWFSKHSRHPSYKTHLSSINEAILFFLPLWNNKCYQSIFIINTREKQWPLFYDSWWNNGSEQ